MQRAWIVPAFALLLLSSLPCDAAAPRIEEIAGRKVFEQGELGNLSLDGDGILRPGPAFDATDLAAPTAWTALRVGDAVWVGTGNGAEVLRVAADGAITRIATGDGLLVTALAPLPEGAVAAAVAPGATVMRIAADGTARPLASLPAQYVWALLPDTRGGLLAASGEPGALWRIDAFGAVEKVADVGDDHARCLLERDQDVLVGTAPKGRVLAVKGGAVEVLRDLEAQEVVGLVQLEDGSVLVAANEDQAGGNPQVLANLLNQLLTVPQADGEKGKAPERASLQNGTVLHLETSGAVTPLWTGEKVAALGLAKDGTGAVVGTYPAGRLVRVEPGRSPAVFADLPEAEASVLLAGPGGLEAVVMSNPAVMHRRRAGAPSGTFTSEPIDGGAVAHWGLLSVAGRGIKGLEVRSGETEEPDDAWGAWQAVTGFDGTSGQAGLAARFLQVRAALEGDEAELRAIRLVVAAPNRAPVVSSLEAKRAGKADATGIPEPTPVRTVEWKAEDPDGDRLSVRLQANRAGSPHWIDLVKDEVLDKAQWTWDTAGLPDGAYRLRLVVSDAPDTPPGEVREVTRTSPPFRVDNTPPRVTVRARVAGDRLLVEGQVEDQPEGRVAQIRASVNGGAWQVFAAEDGLLDEATETFAASLPLPAAGDHDVVVQARDADGNLGAGAAVVTVR